MAAFATTSGQIAAGVPAPAALRIVAGIGGGWNTGTLRSVARAERTDRALPPVVVDPFRGAHPPPRAAAAREPLPVGVARAPPEAPDEGAPADAGFLARTRAFEARLLREALEASRFNQKQAASRLGLTYYQFRHHLRVHGLLPGRRDGADVETGAP